MAEKIGSCLARAARRGFQTLCQTTRAVPASKAWERDFNEVSLRSRARQNPRVLEAPLALENPIFVAIIMN